VDDYLKLKLDKMSDDNKAEVTKYLLGVTEDAAQKRFEEISLDVMADFTDEAIERYKNFGKMQGLSSGYQKIDDLTKGLVDGELTVIAGKTSYGKTTVAINIANEVALQGKPVLFVTLEMTKAEITSRFMQINGGNTDDYQKVSGHIAFQKTNELNWKSIDPLVQKFTEQFEHGLIIIDHLHYFTRELENVAEDLGRITKELKKNADNHKVPIILISHVRKTHGNSAAGIDDLRGTSYIAQDADIVLMVGRREESQTEMRIKIEKNRNRGYDFNNNAAEMHLDKIKLYDYEPVFND
jgi:replicative DNA helicase